MLSRRLPLIYLAAALGLLPIARPARAELDPQTDKPYRLQVVLDVAEHRQFTRIFLDRIVNNLHDLLQANFGNLARVEVVRTHPLLKEIHAKGLEKALDGYTQVSETKTHLLRLRFVDGRYELESRQHDGLTGISSPLVRTDETADSLLVPRKMAQLVNRDFGLVGTVTKADEQRVVLALKGGGLGVPLGRWVDRNEVFAVSVITRGPRGLRASPMKWAFLQVVSGPRDGACTCKFYRRFPGDTLSDQPDVLGYRCLRLATVAAPLRLRLLDTESHAPHNGWQVHVSSTGFDHDTKNFATKDDGTVPTDESYRHAAFVTVLDQGKVRARLPIAMLGDHQIDCFIDRDPAAEAEGQKRLRRDRWLRRIYDSLRVASDRVTELNALGKKSLRRDLLLKAQDGLQSMTADLKSLREEHDRLQNDGIENLKEGEQRLEELRKRRAELDGFVTRLAKGIRTQKDPKKRESLALIAQAQLAETQADFGPVGKSTRPNAIDLYDKALEIDPKQPAVRKRLAALRTAWGAVQNMNHRWAREYIYLTWTEKMEPAALKKILDDDEIQRAFRICSQYHDTLAPQKILRADIMHTDTLKKRFATLKPKTREDDRNEAEIISRASAKLKELHEDVVAYLKREKPKFP
jgi:hypothetical protein